MVCSGQLGLLTSAGLKYEKGVACEHAAPRFRRCASASIPLAASFARGPGQPTLNTEAVNKDRELSQRATSVYFL